MIGIEKYVIAMNSTSQHFSYPRQPQKQKTTASLPFWKYSFISFLHSSFGFLNSSGSQQQQQQQQKQPGSSWIEPHKNKVRSPVEFMVKVTIPKTVYTGQNTSRMGTPIQLYANALKNSQRIDMSQQEVWITSSSVDVWTALLGRRPISTSESGGGVSLTISALAILASSTCWDVAGLGRSVGSRTTALCSLLVVAEVCPCTATNSRFELGLWSWMFAAMSVLGFFFISDLRMFGWFVCEVKSCKRNLVICRAVGKDDSWALDKV